MFLAAFTSALQVYLQAVHRKTAWLSRDFPSTCPHAEQRWLVWCGLIFSTLPGALFSRRPTSRPHPDRMMLRFSPLLARTFRPGLSLVPFAERVMLLIFKSSTLITSNRRARSVLVFSTQSLSRSVSRARSRAAASRTCVRRSEPRRARASFRSSRRSLFRSGTVRPGTRSSSPVDRAADTATPRSTPTTSPLPGAWIGSGMAAKAMCQRPARSIGHPVGLHSRRYRPGPAEPHPTDLRHPDLADFPAEPTHLPLLSSPPHNPEPLVPSCLTPRRAPIRILRIQECGHRPGEIPEGLLLHRLGSGSQPCMLRPGLGELPALLDIAWRPRAARAPVRVLLDGQIPHVPGVRAVIAHCRFLGGRGQQPVSGHTNTVAMTTDISGGVKQRFLPGPKASVSAPRPA